MKFLYTLTLSILIAFGFSQNFAPTTGVGGNYTINYPLDLFTTVSDDGGPGGSAPLNCGGAATDDAPGNYSDCGCTQIITICPSVPGELIELDFTEYGVNAQFDYIILYDNNTNSGTVLFDGSTGSSAAEQCMSGGTFFEATGGTGCLTIEFVSSTVVNTQGFLATITSKPPPTCINPTALAESGLTPTQVDFSWTDNNVIAPALGWQISYGAPGFTAGAGTQVLTSTNPYTLTGLTAATTYDWYVRAICAPGDTSSWSSVSTFQTPCAVIYGGTYTIGPAVTDDWPSFSAAITALELCGINAPVTINVAADTYNESVSVTTIPGSSAANTVTFDGGAAASVLLTSDGTGVNNATISLDGTGNMIFQNITVENTNAGGDAWGVFLTNGTDNITIDNCIVTLATSTTFDRACIVSSGSATSAATTGNNADNLTVSNCTISGAYYGIRLNGEAAFADWDENNVITNNTISAYLYGTYMSDQNGVQITNNSVDMSASASTGADGIYNIDVVNFTITGNSILARDWGIYITDGNLATDGAFTTRGLVANNMAISEADYGIGFDDVEFTDVYHNSCLGEPAMRVNDAVELNVVNNIFVSNGDFAFEDIDITLPANAYTSFDYNIFNTGGTNLIDIDGTFYTDLATFQVDFPAFNANSFEGDPLFTSPTDLHVIGTLANDVGDNGVGITEDIDGDTRPLAPSTTVDIGADEFAPPACVPPGALSVTLVNSTTVDLSWMENNAPPATSWQISYGSPGFTAGSGTEVVTSSNPETVSGLTAVTTYDWYVRTICSVGDTSDWSAVNTFTTPPEGAQGLTCVSGGVTTIVFSEEFDDNSAGWTGDVGTGNNNWEIPDDAGSTGTGAANAFSGLNYMNYESSNFSATADTGRIVSPAIDLSTGSDDAELSFWFHAFGANMGRFEIGVGNSPTGPFTTEFTWLGDFQQTENDDWINIGVDLSTYVGQTIYISIFAEDTTGDFTSDFCVDLFEVSTCLSCSDPTALSASSITPTQADLSWTDNNSPAPSGGWQVSYGAPGFTAGSGTQVLAGTNPYTLTGLNQATTYDWYVRAICAPGDTSSWSSVSTFQTPCAVIYGGTYTIGPAVTDDWPSFSAAITALELCGINAPVTINVAADTYNESVSVTTIPGSSAANTVTFDGGAAASVLLTSDGTGVNNATISLDGTGNMIFQNITVENTNAGGDAWGVFLTNGTDNITIDNCIVTLPTNSTFDRACIVSSGSATSASTTGNNADNLTVSNCTISGAYYGIRLNGEAAFADWDENNVITNNTISAYLYGTYMSDQNGVQITNNLVDMSASASTGADGIYNFDLVNFNISGNTVTARDFGIYVSDGNLGADGAFSSRGLIANNMVTSESNSGIYFDDVEFTDVYHNSSFAEPAMRVNDAVELNVVNNIFVSNGDFAFEDIDITLPANAYTSFDYNIFNTGGTNLIDIDGTFYTDLASFQVDFPAFNANSFEGDPLFTSPTDLHVIGTLANDVGDNGVGITEDIDGDTRPLAPSTTVDIGADEFAPPACVPPGALSATLVNSTTVDLSWMENNAPPATSWQISYGSPGFTAGSGTEVVTSSNPETVSGLTAVTTYDWYVRAICGVGDTSDWSAVNTFTTPPEGAQGLTCVSGGVTAIVFSEEFDDNSAGWTGDVGTGNNNWEIPDDAGSIGTGAANAFSGLNYMNYESSNSSTTADTGRIVSPAIDLSAGSDDAELSFWFHAFGSNMGRFEIGVGNTPTGPFTTEFTWLGDFQQTENDDWINIGVDLSTYVGQTIYISIFAEDTTGDFTSDFCVDLFEVSTCLSCSAPTALSASSITPTQADLSWTDNNSPAPSGGWQVSYGAPGFTAGSGTQVSAGTNALTITGLSAATTYDWYVRSICSVGDTSSWSLVSTFQTPCTVLSPLALPYLGDFESAPATTLVGTNGVFYCNPPDAIWDFETDNPSTGRIRAGSDAFLSNGTGSFTLDVSASSAFATNYVIATFDMSAYTTADPVVLSFEYADHGDEVQADDRVWVRGSSSDSWVEIYDWSTTNNPAFISSGDLDVSATLIGAAQSFSSTFQIRFGQDDNFPAQSGVSDGLSVDDVRLFLSNVNIWTGATSTDWGTGSNWSNGTVPSNTVEIIIPTVPSGNPLNFPVAAQNVESNNLTIEAGASLTMEPTYGLIIGAGGSITNNGAVTLRADATGTAWLDDFTNAGASYVGDITVQQQISPGSGLGQRYFGSPIDNGIVSGIDMTYATGYPLGQLIPSGCSTTALAAGSPYSNLFEWNEAGPYPTNCYQEGWYAISSSTPLTNGRGYSGWFADGSIFEFTGSPNTGAQSYMANTTTGAVPSASGWHVLSNPYPSLMDVAAAFDDGFLSPTYYDGSSGAFEGTFQPVLVSGDLIPIGNGFVAQTGGNAFTPDNTYRAAGSATFKNGTLGEIKLDVQVEGNGFADVTYLWYDNSATAGFDNRLDCVKRPSASGQPTIYSNSAGGKLALNVMGMSDLGTSIPLSLEPGADGNFTFTVNGLETLPASSIVYLEDKFDGTWTNLRTDNSYTFEMLEEENPGRFELHFTRPVIVSSTEETCAGNDASISLNFGGSVINNSLIEWDYSIVTPATVEAGQEGNVLELSQLEPGLYTITYSYDNYSITTELEIEDVPEVQAGFTPSVNAALAGEVIEFTNTSSGATDYEWLINGETINNMDVNYVFTEAGDYIVELISSNNQCDDTHSEQVSISAKTTSIADVLDTEEVRIYVQGEELVVDLTAAKLQDETSLQVYDLIGQLLLEKLNVQGIERFDMGTRSEGYYIVKIINGKETITKKVPLFR